MLQPTASVPMSTRVQPPPPWRYTAVAWPAVGDESVAAAHGPELRISETVNFVPAATFGLWRVAWISSAAEGGAVGALGWAEPPAGFALCLGAAGVGPGVPGGGPGEPLGHPPAGVP